MQLRRLLFLFLFLLPACAAEEPPRHVKIAFAPTEVRATRFPFGADCGKEIPFTDRDVYSLEAIDAAAPNDVSIVTVAFTSRATTNVPLHLTVGEPVFGISQGSRRSASAPDPRIGAGVVVSTRATPIVKPLAKATVTVLAVPTKDGDPMSAHVTLDFADGDVLDATFTGTLVSDPGNCDTRR